MASFNRLSKLLMAGASCAALAACGANDIASPGTGGNVTINNPPAPAPAPTPTPTPTPTVTPAGGCPTIADPQGLIDSGTVTVPTGTWRVCTLPARIQTSITLPKINGLLYRMASRVDVGCDRGPDDTFANITQAPCAVNTGTAANPTLVTQAPLASVTLTIAPGVIIFGGSGQSWLHVNRGNRINAVGTPTAPIIFTSSDNVSGLNSDSSSGQWGGVVLSGRAPITDCAAPAATPGTVACERQTEGATAPAIYGGATVGDNSGTMRYVQIRYSGFVLSGNSELQALTTQGVGNATVISHIQSHNSSDDAAEFFGGRVSMKYFIATGAEDDNLDTDTGLKGRFQYVLVIQRAAVGDSMIEADSDNALDGNIPRQNVQLANFTFRQNATPGNATAMLLRGGTDYTMVNGVVVSPNATCLAISRPQTAAAVGTAPDEAGPPVFRSVAMQCAAARYSGRNGVTDAQVAAIFGTGTNNNNDNFTPTLTGTGGYINGANETGVAAFNPTTLPDIGAGATGFFDATSYVGAVRDASDTWYRQWTCNSSFADFGTGNSGLCTTLPIT